MIRFMLDTDTPGADLPGSHLFATYADLIRTEAELAAIVAKHPAAVIVAIDRRLGDPLGMASVCDIEPGSFTSAEFPAWFDRKKAAGIEYLTAYSDRASLAAIEVAARPRPYFRWVATLDGTTHIAGFPAGRAPAAVQFANAQMLGFHADGSLVFEDGWHPQPVGVRVRAVDLSLRYSDGSHVSAVVPIP